MQAIPAIIENRIVPAIGSFKKAPMKKPTIPAMTIIMTDATVLNFFFPPSIPISQFQKLAFIVLFHSYQNSFLMLFLLEE